MVRSKSFIEQTARDYDLPVWVVEKASKQYPDDIYGRLEEILVERRSE